MRKALIFCGFFLFLNTVAFADSNQALDKVLAKQCWFSGNFSQEKSLKGLPVPLKSSGKFLFDCERGLIWHTATPIIDTKIYSTSSSHFSLNEKREIEVLDDVIQTTIATLLLDIMSANTESIANSFIVSSSDSNSILLTPNSAFLKRGIQSIALKKYPQQNSLLIELLDNKSQYTRIMSVKTQKGESKKTSFINCQKLFKNKVTCDIFDDPSSYETNSE